MAGDCTIIIVTIAFIVLVLGLLVTSCSIRLVHSHIFELGRCHDATVTAPMTMLMTTGKNCRQSLSDVCRLHMFSNLLNWNGSTIVQLSILPPQDAWVLLIWSSKLGEVFEFGFFCTTSPFSQLEFWCIASWCWVVAVDGDKRSWLNYLVNRVKWQKQIRLIRFWSWGSDEGCGEKQFWIRLYSSRKHSTIITPLQRHRLKCITGHTTFQLLGKTGRIRSSVRKQWNFYMSAPCPGELFTFS